MHKMEMKLTQWKTESRDEENEKETEIPGLDDII